MEGVAIARLLFFSLSCASQNSVGLFVLSPHQEPLTPMLRVALSRSRTPATLRVFGVRGFAAAAEEQVR